MRTYTEMLPEFLSMADKGVQVDEHFIFQGGGSKVLKYKYRYLRDGDSFEKLSDWTEELPISFCKNNKCSIIKTQKKVFNI